MRNGRVDLIGAALLLLLAPQAGAAKTFKPRNDYEELTQKPKPMPVIPTTQTNVVRAVSPDLMIVAGLDGAEIPVDIVWHEPKDFQLLVGGRYLGYALTGYEAFGYVLVDRAMAGKAAVIDTGAEPTLSPDGRFMAAVDLSESGYGNLNGIALWEILPRATTRRFFTDALPWGIDWRVDGWVSPDCVAVSRIVEEWVPKNDEEYSAGRDSAPRRQYWLVVKDAGVDLLNSAEPPNCGKSHDAR